MRPWGIKGCATTIFEVEHPILPPSIPETLRNQLEKDGMIAKLSWSQSKQVSEREIIKEISKSMRNMNPEDWVAVKGHVLDLIAYRVFNEYETKKIREDLGIEVEDMENQVLILSLFCQLKPITDLEGKKFFRVWWDCILCHWALWEAGIHHSDISESNLMYYEHDNKIMGILNDFDLATLESNKGLTGLDCTGTLPFMACSLLQSDALHYHVEHLYEHDLESFFWVLTWIAH
ncbi:hypothetical protein FRC02_004848 [Tulasnella sp. 418]|nr:hypothetical protein FRC02_004848 [Tulasnella sp. 418]